jgi:hypothetical protein
MFLIRRVCKIERKDSWKVAKLLTRICGAYEKNTSRGEATSYMGGTGFPAEEITVCAEWIQETIEAYRLPNAPDSVLNYNVELSQLISEYEIEFLEVATGEKLAERS